MIFDQISQAKPVIWKANFNLPKGTYSFLTENKLNYKLGNNDYYFWNSGTVQLNDMTYSPIYNQSVSGKRLSSRTEQNYQYTINSSKSVHAELLNLYQNQNIHPLAQKGISFQIGEDQYELYAFFD